MLFFFSFLKNNNGTFKKSRTTKKGPCLQVHVHIVPRCGSGLTAHSILAAFQILKQQGHSRSQGAVLLGPTRGKHLAWSQGSRFSQAPRTLAIPSSPNQSQELEILGNLFWSPQGTLSGTEPSPNQQEMTPQPIPAPLWEDGVSLPVLSPASKTPHWCPGSQPTQAPPATPSGHSSRHKSDRYAAASTDPHQDQLGPGSEGGAGWEEERGQGEG